MVGEGEGMNIARRAHRLVLWTGLVAIVAYAVALPSILFGMLGVAGGLLAWWLRASGLGRRVPRWSINLLVFAALVYTVQDAVRHGITIRQIAMLIATLIVLKMFDRSRAKDYAQIITLSIFLVIGAVLESVLMRVGMVVAVYLPLAVVAIMAHHMVEGHEAAEASADNPWTEASRVRLPIIAGVHARRHLRGAAIGSIVLLLFATGIVFVIVPRGIGEEMFGRMDDANRTRSTRFATTVNLGEAGQISTSSRPVMHVEVHDDRGQPIGSPNRMFYLRGNVLDNYDQREGQWSDVDARRSLEYADVTPGEWYAYSGRLPTSIRQRITILDAAAARGFLFATYRPVAARFERAVGVYYDPRTARLMVPRETRGRLTYEVESVAVFPDDAGDRTFRNTASFPNTRIGALARQLLDEAGVPISRERTREEMLRTASVLRDYFRDFVYTLDDTGAPPGTDPTEWFIFERRAGHCEYFASALAAMCRSVGLPARVVTGYVAAEWNAASGHYVVRESNAHAWVEVSIGAGQWRVFDATPGDAMAALHQSPRGWLDQILDVVGAAEHWWLTYIVTFSQNGEREAAGGEIPSLLRRLIGDPREGLETIKSTTWDDAARYATIALVVISLALAAFFVLRSASASAAAMIARAWPRKASAGDPRAHLVYRQLLRTLARRGIPKPAWQPPMDFAETVHDPALAELVRRVARSVYAATFGGADIPPDEWRRMEREVRALARAR